MEALHDLNLPVSGKRIFEQGLRRHCTLIAAQVDRDNVEEAVRVLEKFEPIDLDGGSREWLRESGSGPAEADAGAPLGAGITGGAAGGMTNTRALPKASDVKTGPTFGIESDAPPLNWRIVRRENPGPLFRTMR